jgi:hypothetical protein
VVLTNGNAEVTVTEPNFSNWQFSEYSNHTMNYRQLISIKNLAIKCIFQPYMKVLVVKFILASFDGYYLKHGTLKIK